MTTLIDVAHAAWEAWERRTSVSGAFDTLRARLGDFGASGDRLVLVADRPPYERASLYPPYKANRRDDDKGRGAVTDLLKGLRGHYPIVGLQGHEADDVIASLVAESERRGERLTVVTGDKDLWCLAERCELRAIKDGATVDRSKVAERFGVRPDQIPDLLALAGDKADNVPGAARCGPKTASLLLEHYATLDAVLTAVPSSDAEIAVAEAELDGLRKARDKALRAASKDAAREQEAREMKSLASEAAVALERDKALRLVHASRDDVEVSARLVRLREDLAVDFDTVFGAARGDEDATSRRADAEPSRRDGGAGDAVGGQVQPRRESQTDLAQPDLLAAPAHQGPAAPRRPAGVTATREEPETVTPQTETMIDHDPHTGEVVRAATPLARPEPAPMQRPARALDIDAPEQRPPPRRDVAPTMRMSASVASLAPALAKAQGEIEMAVKDSTNPQYRRTYADLASVFRACRPALAGNGLAVVQVITAGHLLTRLMHGDEWIESDVKIALDEAMGRTPVQSLGSAITYLRRYALASLVGVAPDDEDDDGAGRQAPQRAEQRGRAA